jgi:hypothetical protein
MSAIASTPKIEKFLQYIENIESDDFMQIVEKYLTDQQIDHFVDHIENFYDISEEESLGILAQIMVTGFLLGLNEKEELNLPKIIKN